jgi:hypothetical protein
METVKNRIELYFKDLQFDEEKHLYTVGEEQLPSVSGLIKNYVKPFPKNAAKKTALKEGITEAEVKARWKAISDEACDRGHRVHIFGEYYPFDRSLKPQCKQEEAVKKFWDDMPEHIVPLIMEIRMYHKKCRYAGTADIVLYNRKDDSIILGDYKTNKDLFKNFRKQTLLGPFRFLLDSPINKYQLQLSYYQILLEQTGVKVTGRKLVWLKKDGTYQMYDLEDYTEILKKELNLIPA